MSTPSQIVRQLPDGDRAAVVAASSHPHAAVRYAAASHPLATGTVLEMLAEDQDPAVAAVASTRLHVDGSILRPSVGELRELLDAFERDVAQASQEHTGAILDEIDTVRAALDRLDSQLTPPDYDHERDDR